LTSKEQNLASKDLLKLVNETPNKKLKSNFDESRTLNTYLDIFKSRIYEIQKNLIHSGKKVNGESIKNILLRIDEIKRKLLPIFYEYNIRIAFIELLSFKE